MNGLLIGRFQPFHLGHLHAIKFALTKVDKLWLGIGSSNKPLNKNNPFSASERREMITASLDNSRILTPSKNIEIFFIPDVNDHQKWIENIDSIVPKYDIVFSNDQMTSALYSKKGVTVIHIPFSNRDIFSGTNVRYLIENNQRWDNLVTLGSRKILERIDAKNRILNL